MPSEWQELVYPISLEYREHWGYWEAIREIKTNALDEAGAYIETKTELGLQISDNGKGLAVKHLLFGVGDKDGTSTRGRFKEGLKIAMIVLRRLGHTVEIHTNGMEVVSDVGNIEGESVLKVRYRKVEHQVKGTHILIIGYHGPTFEERFSTNKEALFTFKFDKILAGESGMLFVKNVFVSKLKNAEFSYDLWDIQLEESRNIPDEDTVQTNIGYLWSKVTNRELLESLFKAVDEKSYEAKCTYAMRFRENKIAPIAFKNVFGKNAVVKTSTDNKIEAEWRGAKVVDIGLGSPDGLTTDEEFIRKDAEEKDLSVTKSEMEYEQVRNLERARRLADKYSQLRWDGRKKYYIIPVKSTKAGKWLGWKGTVGMIHISKAELNGTVATVGTLVHELAHSIGGVDNTIGMIEAITEVAALLLCS